MYKDSFFATQQICFDFKLTVVSDEADCAFLLKTCCFLALHNTILLHIPFCIPFYFSLFGGTGFSSFTLPADVRDIEQFVFSLNNISLYGVIHSFTSKCYLCGEVSQTPSPFISIDLQAHINFLLEMTLFYSSIDTFPLWMSLTLCRG